MRAPRGTAVSTSLVNQTSLDMTTERHADIVTEILKSSPPVAVTSGAFLFGLTINEWVGIATLAYIALQAVVLVLREIDRQKDKKKEDNK
jgi:predicted MFS family arabinose efflux permease